MKILLQFAFASFARIDRATLRTIWTAIEQRVTGLELARFQGGSMSGVQKLESVIERVSNLIPDDRKEIGTQIIRAIVEIVLISVRLKGGAR